MKVAVFGKPGGGKSTLSREIAAIAGVPLHQLDLVQYAEGGARIPDAVFLKQHSEILADTLWVIDGFGTPQAFEQLLRAADILVYVERAQITHYWWITKRLLKSPLSKPLGWPRRSPMLKSTISSYRFLGLSHRFWTPAFREKILALRPGKRVYIVTNKSDAMTMLNELQLVRSNGEA